MVGASKFVPRAAQETGTTRSAPGRAWAGRGTGARCDLCHRLIDEDQIEYEVELPERRNQILTLHLECYEQWTLAHDPFGSLEEEKL